MATTSLLPIGQLILQPSAIAWLWRPYVAGGKLTLLDGDPGCAKSLLTIDLAARLSRGSTLPDGQPSLGPSRTMILNAEDDPADTVLPRLRAANADLDYVFVPNASRSVEMPRLPEDLDHVEALVRDLNIALLIVDSLSSFLPERHCNGNIVAVRQMLAPLAYMADRTGVAVVLVRHLNKAGRGRALYRGLGSIGIAGLARTVLLAGEQPGDPSYNTLSVIKSNLSAIPAPLAYRAIDRDQVGAIEWLGAFGVSTDEAKAFAATEDSPGLVHAGLWLLDALAGGPRPAVEILAAAKADGIRERTLETAKRMIKVASKFTRDAKGNRAWLWCPPYIQLPSPLGPLDFDFERLPDPLADSLPPDTTPAIRNLLDRERLRWASKHLLRR